MRTVELLREDEWSTEKSRRKVVAGVTTWPDEGIPILGWYDDPENGGKIIGIVVNIRREGNRIVGDTNYNTEYLSVGGDYEPHGLGVIDPMGYAHNDGLTFGSYRVRYGMPCTKDQYIWKD